MYDLRVFLFGSVDDELFIDIFRRTSFTENLKKLK